MTRKLILYIFINICLITSYAQSITVDPEVICAGENAYLATDTNVNYVHIGDILCFLDDDTANYIIVRPEVWEQYADAGYTPLSVVFYVDQTGKHGWAVQAAASYSKLKWYTNTTDAHPSGLTTYVHSDEDYLALKEMDGEANTAIIKNTGNANYIAAYSTQMPFYLPALGQLYYLYTKTQVVNVSIGSLSGMTQIPLLATTVANSVSWSSTVSSTTGRVYAVDRTGVPTTLPAVASTAYVLPVMNF